MASLDDKIDQQATYALNLQPSAPLANLYLPDDRMVARSDDDEQMLIHFAFQEAANLTHVKIRAPDTGEAPAKVKLFVNRVSMSFSDCDQPCAQEFALTAKDYAAGAGEATLALRSVKFLRVTGLTVFIESNVGDKETTAVSHIKFVGSLAGKTDMSALKKVGADE